MALKRQRHPMPYFIKKILNERRLMSAYLVRPAYQQNDYIGWITRAKQEETRQRRLNIMIDELSAGHGYMNMPYRPKHH